MQKNGVVMDVTNVEQALIAQEAGAVSVMVLDKLPSEVRKAGGVARTASIKIIEEIMDSVTIPVMAKCRIGHVSEALVLQETDVDMIDESEVLTPADESNHIWKHDFTIPFVCGCRNLGEALRRIGEGAAMIRTKGEAGTGNIVEAVRHARSVLGEIIAAPSPMRLNASPKFLQPQTNGIVKSCFQMWFDSSAGVKTSDSSIISTSVSCKTNASLTCPILHLAITGIVTESIISSIIFILAVRATPPAFLTSDGSLSKTITETAPAS
jgi:pyridoxal 5'-phosphate synthase subunit Pdx1